jgi:membrane protease YdiL (CAAX protease family)
VARHLKIGGSTIGAWIFAVGTGIMMAFVAFGTIRSGQLLRVWTPPTNLLLSVPDNGARVLGIGFCLLLGSTAGPGGRQLGWSPHYLAANVLVGIVTGVAVALMLGAVGLAATRHWGRSAYSTKMLQCILPANGREWILVLLALWPAAALEELLFRSLPLGGLGWLASPWWLLWPLALFFGLLHWPQGGWGIVGTTLLAVLLSWLFLATSSIWPPLIAHYLINMSQLVAAKLSGLQPLRAA